MSVLQVFKALPVARGVVRRDVDVPGDYAADTITMGWEDRMRARGRRTSDAGFGFGIALPRGTVLQAGDRLVFDTARTIVSIVERDEPVFVVTPSSLQEWALFAYHIGNNHQPLMVVGEGIVCPDVPGMEQLLLQHRMPFRRDLRPFTPVGVMPDHRH
jgi:urease accessory protein